MESPRTILLIEDEEMLLDLLQEMLETEGYRILISRNGLDGVEIYRKFRGEIALVLSDMGLPGIGGWEVLKRILAIDASAKVILSSGFMDPKIREEMIQAGAVDFIQKPYVLDKVMGQIRYSIGDR